MKTFERVMELEGGETNYIWANVLPLGEFYDSRYGKVEITQEMIKQMVENFKKGIPHYQPPINLSHDDKLGAFGYVEELEAREDGLWAKLVFSDEGKKLLEERKFRYLSAEFAESYIEKKTGKNVGYVFLGVALTNRPAHPGVQPITLAEQIKTAVKEVLEEMSGIFKFSSVPNWPVDEDSPWNWDWTRDADEIVNKFGWATLAKACAFVDTENFEKGPSGYPEVKAAYKLPFAKVKNGKMTIYKRGVIAAMQALLGARGGTKIPRDKRKSVYNKLAKLYRRFDMEPPEFHLEEVEEVHVKELEEKLKTFEEQVKKLEEEKKELEKKLEEAEKEKKELEEKLLKNEVDGWAKEWIDKGVPPAVVEKFKVKLLEAPENREFFDEVLENIANPKLTKQLSETDGIVDSLKRAEIVAKTVFGGDER